MKPDCDLHMHSSFSEDSEAPMEEMIRSAIAKGLRVICFTEHMDPDFPPDGTTFLFDPAAYEKEIRRCQNLYGGRITVLMGVELGMQPHLAQRLAQEIAALPYDFIIASQHLAGRADPWYPEFWEGRSADEAIRAYYAEMLEDVRMMPSFDTLAHLDYVTRYMPEGVSCSGWEAHADLIDEILREVIRRGAALEVNTSGFRSRLAQQNPCEGILRRYRELGGSLITIGSDAHEPSRIAGFYEETAALLRRTGFEEYCVFKGRTPHLQKL